MIARNRQDYDDGHKTFLLGNFGHDDLPQVDVIMCRDCLVHFSWQDVWAAVRNFKRSQSRYLLTTTFINFPANVDIETGGWQQINFERQPFAFPPPERSIDEKCLHSGGIYADKRLALWRLDDIVTR